MGCRNRPNYQTRDGDRHKREGMLGVPAVVLIRADGQDDVCVHMNRAGEDGCVTLISRS